MRRNSSFAAKQRLAQLENVYSPRSLMPSCLPHRARAAVQPTIRRDDGAVLPFAAHARGDPGFILGKRLDWNRRYVHAQLSAIDFSQRLQRY